MPSRAMMARLRSPSFVLWTTIVCSRTWLDKCMLGPRYQKTGLPTMHSLNTVETINDLFSIVVGMIRIVSAKAKPMEITPQSLLLEELALDSLDLVRVIMLIEDRYYTAIDLDEIPKMKRVDDLTRILSRELRSAA
jgi:acyl carrier protein